MRNETSPARVYALVFGAVLVVAGIIGFFYSSDFGSPGKVDGVLGILDVNGWHNVVHIASGVLGLALAGSYDGSRLYALGLGVVYVAIAVWGFALGNDNESLLSIIPINTEDDVLHAAIGVLGLATFLASPAPGVPADTRPTAA